MGTGSDEVDVVHQVAYRRLLPLLVTVGLLFNLLSLAVLSRPALRHTKVNSYLMLLSACDLLVCIFHIPVITTITGCIHSSYTDAFYFAHFGWTLVGVSQTFGTYTILWLSVDRFMAVWMYDLYPRLQQRPHVIRNRLLATGIACVLVHVVYMVDADTQCTSDVPGDTDCEQGRWISISGYQLHYDYTWHKVFRILYSLIIRWIPSALLLGFNAGLVIGVAKGRLTFPSSSHPNSERNLVTTTIGITFSYIVLTLPIVIYITAYASTLEDRCTGYHSKEILRAAGNFFQLLENVIHIVFMVGLNHGFRKELKVFLRLEKCAVKGEGGDGEAENGKSHHLSPRQGHSNQLDHSVTSQCATRNTSLDPC